MIKENDITISIVRETKPEKLFKYFKNNNTEVTLKANSSLAEELIGDVKMGEMILKIVQPLILEKEKKAKIEGIEKGKILGAIEILRSFNSNDDIKTIIMDKYHLTESDAKKYLQ